MKKSLIYVVLIVAVLALTGCVKSNEDSSVKFKKEYESLNGTLNKSGKEHRILNISVNNPFEYISAEELVKKIENNETFYVYFGDKLCPWCRSVVEKAIEVANKKKITKVYYIAIWDDKGNEILRDKYEYKDGKIEKIVDGTKAYYDLLKYFDEFLSDYMVNDSDGNKISTGEKRIYAPNFVYVKSGKAAKLITGISESQTDPRAELTEEVLKDQEEAFNNFFE